MGCERCHGGDPATVESFLAHQGILSSRDPAEGRMMLTSVREVRESLDQARRLIRPVTGKDRRGRLAAELEDARAPLAEAIESAQMFVFEPMQERPQVARKRAELLLEELANPTPSVSK